MSWLEASLLNKDSSDAQDRIFVSFESMAHFGDLVEVSDATFSAEGSAIVKFGDSQKNRPRRCPAIADRYR